MKDEIIIFLWNVNNHRLPLLCTSFKLVGYSIFDIRIIFVYAQYDNFQKCYPAIHFPQFHPKIFTPIPWRGLPWAHRILSRFSGSPQNRVVLISVYPITRLIYIELGRVPLNFGPSGHPFPPISPQIIYIHFMEGSPLSTSDFILVFWFTPELCGTHFRLPHHLAYIHWTW